MKIRPTRHETISSWTRADTQLVNIPNDTCVRECLGGDSSFFGRMFTLQTPKTVAITSLKKLWGDAKISLADSLVCQHQMAEPATVV